MTACSLVFMPPWFDRSGVPFGLRPTFFDRRLVVALCAFSQLASIITVFGAGASDVSPLIIRAKMTLSLHRFQRL